VLVEGFGYARDMANMTNTVQAKFSFDPACPWTWRTSRWLVDVARRRDIELEWSSFSLAILNEDSLDELPPERRAWIGTSARALRLVEALRADERDEDVGRFYRELGVRVHERGRDLDEAVLAESAHAAGVGDAAAAFDDAHLDALVRESHDQAFAAAGPDVGSPVLQIQGCDRGLHGPILAEALHGKDALELWDSVAALMAQPAFYELKRGRG
jgi:predicted DsbA family dithiol-disulfide isomerase